jgi:hypothetical protein
VEKQHLGQCIPKRSSKADRFFDEDAFAFSPQAEQPDKKPPGWATACSHLLCAEQATFMAHHTQHELSLCMTTQHPLIGMLRF